MGGVGSIHRLWQDETDVMRTIPRWANSRQRTLRLWGHFSYMLARNLAGGISARFITSYIGDYNSIAMGVDLGLNYYDPEQDLSISAVAKNLGGQLKAYDEEYEKMPIDLQVGATKRFESTPFRILATLVNLNHWDSGLKNHLVVGAELLLGESLWLGADIMPAVPTR